MAKFNIDTATREELVEADDPEPRTAKDMTGRTADVFASDGRQGARTAPEATPDKAAEMGRRFIDLVQEQTTHNLCMMLALTQARHWNEVIQIQQDYLRTSMALMARLANSSVAMLQTVVTSSLHDEADRKR